MPSVALPAGAALAVGLLFFVGGLALRSGPALSATVTKPQPEKKPKKRPCCAIGIAYLTGGSKVTLTQVCNSKGRSVFHFQTHGVASACTHPPGTVLRDQKGRRYKMFASYGLPECSSGTFSRSPNLKFRWEFAPLKTDVKKFTLLEVEDDVTAGLSFWAWRDIDVSHCRF
ncbi:MAG: hypothetical protein RIF32_18460 [Leptospirales bacterium]